MVRHDGRAQATQPNLAPPTHKPANSAHGDHLRRPGARPHRPQTLAMGTGSVMSPTEDSELSSLPNLTAFSVPRSVADMTVARPGLVTSRS